jgi:hypothetical protein
MHPHPSPRSGVPFPQLQVSLYAHPPIPLPSFRSPFPTTPGQHCTVIHPYPYPRSGVPFPQLQVSPVLSSTHTPTLVQESLSHNSRSACALIHPYPCHHSGVPFPQLQVSLCSHPPIPLPSFRSPFHTTPGQPVLSSTHNPALVQESLSHNSSACTACYPPIPLPSFRSPFLTTPGQPVLSSTHTPALEQESLSHNFRSACALIHPYPCLRSGVPSPQLQVRLYSHPPITLLPFRSPFPTTPGKPVLSSTTPVQPLPLPSQICSAHPLFPFPLLQFNLYSYPGKSMSLIQHFFSHNFPSTCTLISSTKKSLLVCIVGYALSRVIHRIQPLQPLLKPRVKIFKT